MHFSLLVNLVSVVKLAKRAKVIGGLKPFRYQRLLRGFDGHTSTAARAGFIPVYVGEERQRFVIPKGFLSHPLFRMLLEMTYREYGFEQRSGLMFPCNVSIFQEVVSAVECSHGQFDLERLVEELI